MECAFMACRPTWTRRASQKENFEILRAKAFRHLSLRLLSSLFTIYRGVLGGDWQIHEIRASQPKRRLR
jgi:hypothetical protein